VPEPARTIEWPDARVALLGQLIGDGSYLSGKPMRYTTASEENSHVVTEAAEREFGAKVTRYPGRGRWHQLLISGNGNRWHPQGVDAWLRELGIFGQRSHEKRLPRDAFRLSNRQVGLLLQHLWATDGCIWLRTDGRGSNAVYFATSSHGLAHDVAALIMRLGIVARIRTARQGRSRPWYNVCVSGAREQVRFLAMVGGFGPRAHQAARLTAVLDGMKPNTNVDTLPREVFGTMRSMLRRQGASETVLAGLEDRARAQHAPSRELVGRYGAKWNDAGLVELATNDLYWDRVVKIEYCGMDDVYDMTVPGPSSWISSSVVVHNSGAIEQDSDVVMFIHRDDTDPATKGTADLIVAKHRNGPTDTVKLAFLPSLTQFRNFAPGPAGPPPGP
jgi:replicative DNA helicase